MWLPKRNIPLCPTLVEADGMPKDLDRVVRTERKVARDEGTDTRHGIPDGHSATAKQTHDMTNQTPRKSIATSLQNVALKEEASAARFLYILNAKATCFSTVSGYTIPNTAHSLAPRYPSAATQQSATCRPSTSLYTRLYHQFVSTCTTSGVLYRLPAKPEDL